MTLVRKAYLKHKTLSMQSLSKIFPEVECQAANITISERHGLKEPKRLEDLQFKIIDALRDHCTYNHEAQQKPHFFSRILGKLPELRSLCREGLLRLKHLKDNVATKPPPVLDALFLESQLPF